jgi:plastocyanin
MWRLALVFVLFLSPLSGCKKKEGPAPGVEAAKQALPPPPTTGLGGIRGQVTFQGAAPEMAVLSRGSEPFCARTRALDESVIVNPNGTLRNAVVRIVKGVGYAYPVPSAPVVVKQVDCTYIPRVQAGMVGQEIAVYNHDPILHNVHTFKGTSDWFNKPQPGVQGVPPIRKKLENGVGMITFRCDIHPWMRAFIAVTDHPFHAVTGEDGSFALSGVPPGKYTVEAWHEKYGSRTAEVEVESGKTATVGFTFRP